MYDLNVGSIVNFTDESIQVFAMSNGQTEYQKLYGYCLLTSEYLSRLYSTVKRDKEAREVLLDTINDVGNLDINLEFLRAGYENSYKLSGVGLKFGVTQENHKRNCSYILGYDLEGHYAPKFSPKGFGVLGKNVEAGSVTACLATLRFLMSENEGNDNILSAIVNTVDLTRNNLADHPKLGIRNEIAVVRAVLAEISSIYGSMYD